MPSKDDILLEEQFAQQRMSRGLLTRLWAYLQPFRRMFWLNLVLSVLATVSQLLGPKLIQVGLDRYLIHRGAAELAQRGLLMVSLIYLGNLGIGWALSILQVRSAIAIGQGAMNNLRLAVFEHIQRLSLNYFDKTHQGRIINRADTDIDALDRVLTWGASQLLSSLITLAGVLLILIRYDWRLCLAVSVVLPPLWAATRLFHVYGMRAYRNLRTESSRVTAALAENIAGVRVVQAFSREEKNLERFNQVQEVYRSRFVEAARLFHTYLPFLALMSGLGTAIILGYGGRLVMRQEITVGQLAAFVLYLGMFFGPIQTMGDLYNAMLSAAASAERIFHLLDTQPQIQNQPQAVALPPLRGHIGFDHVWLRYDTTPADTWVLQDICFEAKPGETVALVGRTGSGKTSIISLLTRFYEPQQGRITVDGLNLQLVTLESLRAQVGIVTQDNFLFTGTVLENLKFGRPDATEAEVVAAAQRLGSHEIIQRLEKGYETKIAERGQNLSAGERQLLCFTRAMVAQPRLLILDEATSAVDPQTEATIQHALDQLFARRTCFVVAHRLSTVRNAHRILVLEGGRIVEQGNHRELLELGGTYARMHGEFVRS